MLSPGPGTAIFVQSLCVTDTRTCLVPDTLAEKHNDVMLF